MRFVAAVLCLVALLQASAFAQPLLQPGKRTVFQRIVSNPNATLYADAQAQSPLTKPLTFTSYYVYAREGDMLQVGVSTTKPQGWLKASDTTEWPQAITMVFTEQMGREPVLFFKNKQQLVDLCMADNIKDTVSQYVSLFEQNGRMPRDSPVMAIEPSEKEGQVSQNNFYLMPVLNMDTQFKDNGTQLLQVACIDPGSPDGAGAAKNAQNQKTNHTKKENAKTDGMTTGIVFVVDTTISMRPYIEKTKDIIRHIYDQLQGSSAKENIAFAVVAYRSNPQIRPKTEYNTLIISDFTTVSGRDRLESLLQRLQESPAATHDFNEDAMAGVKAAVDSLSWDKVNAKLLLLITDAGPLSGEDKYSHTHMSAEGMADYLRTRDIKLLAIHIKTPNGKRNHNYAERNYKELSKLSNNRSSYISIDALTPDKGASEFQNVGNTVAKVFCKIAEKQALGGKPEKPTLNNAPENASPEEKARFYAEACGYAMQLKFAGDQNDTHAPRVVNAWIADADLGSLEADPSDAPVPAVYPAVLLTKVQLSQLRKQLIQIIKTAEEAFLNDSSKFNFYEQLISATAQMSRDPTSFSKDPNANLAQKGVLLEVLDGLPYKSRVLSIKKDDWVNMSTGEQLEFMRRLKGLVQLYAEYDKDNTHWEGFGSTNPNEFVYRVPLNKLP